MSNKHRDVVAAAGVLYPILNRLKLSLNESNFVSTFETVLSLYDTFDAVDRKLVRKALLLSGLGDVVDALKGSRKYDNSNQYTCSVMQTLVVSPCEIANCKYHVDRDSYMNCLLILSNEKEMRLSATAVALGISEKDVYNLKLSAFRKMRQSVVSIAKENEDLSAQFVFLKTEKVCGVCEKTMQGSPFYTEGGVSFCSLDCCQARPISHTILESRFGIDAGYLIRWIVNNFDDLEAAAQSLCFPVSVLTNAMNSSSTSNSNERTTETVQC